GRRPTLLRSSREPWHYGVRASSRTVNTCTTRRSTGAEAGGGRFATPPTSLSVLCARSLCSELLPGRVLSLISSARGVEQPGVLAGFMGRRSQVQILSPLLVADSLDVGIFSRKPADPVAEAAMALERLDPEERANLFANSSQPPTWAQVSGYPASAGVPVTLDSMISIPAVSAAIRFLSETIAMLPLNVYKGRGAEKTLADQTWQYRLLAELPGMGDFTPV